MSDRTPILNSPYEPPTRYYETDPIDGSLNYDVVRDGRRIFRRDVQIIPEGKKANQERIWADVNDLEGDENDHLINRIREEVGKWRKAEYPDTTRVTRDLLHFWFMNPEKPFEHRLFFAQQEAVETAIWLNEVAARSNAGQHILSRLRDAQGTVSADPAQQLPRIAYKMATGSGKTVVMGALILYHYFNRRSYRNDTRFADNFLIIAPGVTIRDRLGVLRVDESGARKAERVDYYSQRRLVPPAYEQWMGGLNARVVVTNYHSLMLRTLQGNKRSPFDGKLNAKGEKQEALEDTDSMLKRVVGNFRRDSRLLVLNDEAHHCYLPQSTGRTTDDEEVDENKKAAVWFSGLSQVSKRFKLQNVYDLSATPYYLQGSGYTAYSLFPWVVSDFGLIEAMESGLVKIPFIPLEDDTQELETPKLKNLYVHVREELPKKGQRRKKSDARAEGEVLKEEPPVVPPLVKVALAQFYEHYVQYEKNLRKHVEAKADLFTRPPVFIAVCNNTSASKELYKWMAGYEYRDANDELITVPGHLDLFSNYDAMRRPKEKAPTLLIDSQALEDGEQVSPEFKSIFASEIAGFKRDYARIHGQGAADNITEAEILREVVNTVGQPGKLGGHIRCVVSVSMLTEGWDANTVTHIMGLRAFGSNLLCEQVAGRALRRRDYFLQGYDKNEQPTSDKRKAVTYRFPPEYAHIIGVPFRMFKGGLTTTVTPPNQTQVRALEERAALEIDFPNVTGYRVDMGEERLRSDFSKLEDFTVDGANFPMETVMATAFSADHQKLQVKQVLEKREQEIIFLIARELLQRKYKDNDGNPQHQHFPALRRIVEDWYSTKVVVLNRTGAEYRKLLYYEKPDRIVEHIARGINPHRNTAEHVRAVLNHHNPWSSTRYVNGRTTKECYPTTKSHVNHVPMDSQWEGICAKTLEELPQVVSYVKNDFLGFQVPYSKDDKDRHYVPDFIARVRRADGTLVHLIIEITGFNTEKEEKKWTLEQRWLPAVNAMRTKHPGPEWHFIEVDDILNIRPLLTAKIKEVAAKSTIAQ